MHPLPVGSTLLDVSETVDNILVTYINSSSPLVSNLANLNTPSNASVFIGKIGRKSETVLQTYSSPNIYIDSGMQGAAYTWNSTISDLWAVYAWNYTSISNVVKGMQTTSKTSQQQIYELILKYDSLLDVYTTELYYRSVSTLAATLIATVGYNCTKLTSSQMGYAYLLCHHSANTYLLVYSASGSLLMNVSQPALPQLYACLTAYANYIAFSIDSTVYAYQISSTLMWTYTLTAHLAGSVYVTDLTIYNAWLCAITNQQYASQFHVGVGKFFDEILISQTKIRLMQNFSDLSLVAWSVNDNKVHYYSITNDYMCPGGCSSCWGGYVLNSTSLSCYVPSATPAPPQPPAIPTPNITNSTNSTAQANASNGSNNYSIISGSGWCSLQDTRGFCLQFCMEGCLACEGKPDNCVVCNQFYYDAGDGTCIMQKPIRLLAIVYSIMQTFRLFKAQSLYLLVNDLQLYQFHYVNYTGVI